MRLKDLQTHSIYKCDSFDARGANCFCPTVYKKPRHTCFISNMISIFQGKKKEGVSKEFTKLFLVLSRDKVYLYKCQISVRVYRIVENFVIKN